MKEDRERPLAGLAKIDRDPSRPFGRLVAAAETSADVGRGLALAYEQLSPAQREELIEAIVRDAEREGVSPAFALLGILSVEVQPEMASRIAQALQECGKSGISPKEAARAFVAGDDSTGAMVLSRPLHGQFVELLGLEWRSDILRRALVEPFLHRDEVPRAMSRVTDRTLTEIEVMRAVDRVSPVLWRHRRTGGSFPVGLERFAELFTI